MDADQKSQNNSRRNFFFSLFSKIKKEEKVKMLTSDGKLVEVDKSVYESLTKKKKTTNKDIYDWMENPSKKDNTI